MTVTGQDVVRIARGWIGTPYRHQASCLKAGTDCLGLIRGIWRDLYGAEPETVPYYTADWAEPTSDEILWHVADKYFERTAAPIQPGDLLLFRMRSNGIAKHLGIAARTGNAPSFIHAYSGHAVLESFLTPPWQRRIVCRFLFPQEV